jgi:hypothetical protein
VHLQFDVALRGPTSTGHEMESTKPHPAAPTTDTPLLVLAAPRSFSSVVSSMIGQHPQMYGLPELELFSANTIAEWWRLCSVATFPRAHGTLRAISQLYFGEQTEATVRRARGWLTRRSHCTTGFLIEMFARKVSPRILVEKSTTTVYQIETMHQAYRMFPEARFLHLVRHPRAQGESVLRFLEQREKEGAVSGKHWMRRLASKPVLDSEFAHGMRRPPVPVDPQRAWFTLNNNVSEFLKSVPEERKLLVRGEDLLANPNRGLAEIANWMGLRTDSEAIDAMKHPERSPYACFGPPGARFGNDRLFLEKPALRPERGQSQSLEGPLEWRSDNHGFLPETKELAEQFGYV